MWKVKGFRLRSASHHAWAARLLFTWLQLYYKGQTAATERADIYVGAALMCLPFGDSMWLG